MNRCKFLIFALFFIIFQACEESEEPIFQKTETLKYTLVYINNPTDTIQTKVYTLIDNKVVSEKYTNYLFPQYSAEHTFQYDETGRLIGEIEDGEVSKKIIWEGDSVKVFNKNDLLIYQLSLEEDRITSYDLVLNRQNSLTFYEYDENGNVIMIRHQNDTIAEYLDYDLSKKHPFYAIRSVAILRMYEQPNFSNIYLTKKDYPIDGGDYYIPLTNYQYYYTFDELDRVHTIENDQSLIYTSIFEYE